MEGDEIYWRRAPVLLSATPHLPLYLLLPVATARPAEGRAEHDGEAEAQHAQEDPWRDSRGGGDGWKTLEDEERKEKGNEGSVNGEMDEWEERQEPKNTEK